MITKNIMINNVVCEIEVLKLFTLKNEMYALYTDKEAKNNYIVFLSKIVKENKSFQFNLINSESTVVLQQIIKELLSDNYKQLKKLGYKEINSKKLSKSLFLNGKKTISLDENKFKILVKQSSNYFFPILTLFLIVIGITSGFIAYKALLKEPSNPNVPVVEKKVLNFETNSLEKINSITVNKGSSVNIKQYVPLNSGFDFSGWYIDTNFENKVADYIIIDNDITLYAKWENAI